MKEIKVFVVGPMLGYAKWIPNNRLVQKIEDADLVLFTGGSDIHPSLYGEESIHPWTSFSKERDKEDVKVYKKAKDLGKFILGICRGAQFLTAMAGGKVVQHVYNHAGPNHEILFSDGEVCEITSTHHQMCWPFLMDEKDYELVAHSVDLMSKRYHFNEKEYLEESDSTSKKLRMYGVKEIKEPEVIYFNKENSLAIQGHPESMNLNSPVVVKLRKTLIEKIIWKS